LWDVATLEQRGTYREEGERKAVACSPDGSLIALGAENGDLSLLRGDGELIARRPAHAGGIHDVAISPDQRLVATGGNDRTARLWSASGEPLRVLAGHGGNITYVGFLPGSERVVTTSADSTARLWTTSGMLLGEMVGHTNIIIGAALDADGRRLATASWDHTVIVWDLARATNFLPIVTGRADRLTKVAFDPAGQRLAVARADGVVSVHDVRSGAVACTMAGGTAIEHFAWPEADELAVVRRGELVVQVLDARRCVVASTLPHPIPVTAMSPRSHPSLATVAGNIVRVWRHGRLVTSLAGYEGVVWSARVDGDDVYALTDDPFTVVVDAIGDPTRRRIFRGPRDTIADVQLDHRAGRLVAASWDHGLHVWDAATGVHARKLEGTGPMWAGRTSPDGSITIGVGGTSPTVWNLGTGAPIKQLEGQFGLVLDGEFLDDQIFLAHTTNSTVVVWDVVTARVLMALDDVDAMTVADDRRTVAFVGPAGVRIWSPRLPAPDLAALRALTLGDPGAEAPPP